MLDVPLSHLNYPPKLPSPRRKEKGDGSDDDDDVERGNEHQNRIKAKNGVEIFTKPRYTASQTSTLLPRRIPNKMSESRRAHDQGALRVRPGMENVVSQIKDKKGGAPLRRGELYARGVHRHCSPERSTSLKPSTSHLPPSALGVINFEHMFWS